MKLVILPLIALALTACDSLAPKVDERSDYASYAQALKDARANPAKSFEIECPSTGCNFTKLVAYQTGANGQEIKPPAAPPRPEHAIVGLVREVKEAALGLAPFASPIFLVGAAMKPMERLGTVFASRPPQTTAITETYNTLTGNGSAMNGATASTANTSNTTTTSTSTTTTNSNNTTRNCQTGQSTGTTTQTTGSANC